MPPPGASAPAFAATAEAARCKSVQERVVERVLRNALHPASILDFRPRLGNRCKLFPVYTLFRASILDFKAKLANRCKHFPDSTLFRASILDFKPKIGNQCIDSEHFQGFRAAILDFRPRIGNRCSDGGLQAELITLRQRGRSGDEDQNRTRSIVATAVCRRN